ncbi:C-X-C motif chemokine 10-like [Scyliorhinus canicula]|uniref:C-X-C motif chemokine 10-like n=1 Tax=Scyliorhinus canicula TaxID=7830 RepID=UPI0018F310CE|nr:C-X-C motif chemokine 10-like [Scyliorhinus canicula]
MVSKTSVTVFSIIALCLVFADALPRLPNQRRCRCIKHAEELQPSMGITNVKIFFKQGLCPNIEIIVNLQNRRICLNPDSNVGRKMIALMRKKINQ